jgi:hypothetical protein
MRIRVTGLVAALALGLAVVAAQAQSPAADAAPADAPRTSWGDPDLQGVWDYRSNTPLERPRQYGDRAYLTEEEVKTLEDRAARNLDEPPPEEGAAPGLIHARYWTDPGRTVAEDWRTSLIVDPPNGQIPALTEEAQARRGAAPRDDRPRRPGGHADTPADRSSLERCITWGLPTAILPGLYNNNIRIVQTPTTVAIVHEMVHDTRVIPLDRQATLSGDIRQWLGDSRGYWEGDTLVVETTNFSDKTSYRGSTPNLKLVERFTRIDDDRLGFELTVEDPDTWVQPWTAAFLMRPSEGELYEYACHESNYGLRNILEVARDEEKAAAAGGGN